MQSEQIPNSKSLGPRTGFHDAAADAARKAMDEIHRNWEGALGGSDVEAIHDLRVGTRRLRAALSVYEAAYPAREFRRVERSMSALTDALGPARDTDVLIEHLEKVEEELGEGEPVERIGIRCYIDNLRQLRERQQMALIRAMNKVDLEQVAGDLETAAALRSD